MGDTSGERPIRVLRYDGAKKARNQVELMRSQKAALGGPSTSL